MREKERIFPPIWEKNAKRESFMFLFKKKKKNTNKTKQKKFDIT